MDNPLNEFLIEKGFLIEQYSHVPEEPLDGWIVMKHKENLGQFEHCGYIFDTQEDAMNFTKGIFPSKYREIDWDLFPDPKCIKYWMDTEKK